ncbi:hypothetical protein [Streptomyces kronopolitis]
MCRRAEYGLEGAEFDTVDDLRRISAAWRTWASDPVCWLSGLHGAIICRARLHAASCAGTSRSQGDAQTSRVAPYTFP